MFSTSKLFLKLSKTQSLIKPEMVSNGAKIICKHLKNNGYQAYIVGGCVRDLIMGHIPQDWDIATNAKPEQTKKIFDGHFKIFDSGIEHGTITIVAGSAKEDQFEVTTYRVDGQYSDGRRPDSIEFVDDISGDLSRRDLTINAIAYDPISNEIVDPFGGIKDIENKIIKAVGNPDDRFSEDGLRTMRAARFAARFGFDLEEETKSAISNNVDVLAKVSAERIRDELLKTLKTPNPSVGLKILSETGALSVAIPKEESIKKFEAKIPIIDRCDGDVETKVSLLFSDISANDVNENLRRLKFSNAEIKKISLLLGTLDKFKQVSDPNPTEIRKILSHIKNSSENYAKSVEQFIKLCDALGLSNANVLAQFSNEPAISKKDLKISGNDIISKLDLKPGPKVKEILDKLYEKVLNDPDLNDTDKLLELASQFEKIATRLVSEMQKNSSRQWWEVSDEEKKSLLNKEYDFGSFKFRAGDVPELASQVDAPAGPVEHHPEKNQLLHNNLVYDRAREISDDPMMWYGAAMHDLGKSFTDQSSWPKQNRHEELGIPHAEKVSDLLGVPPEWKEFAALVAGNHLKSHKAKELRPQTIKKLFELFKSDKDSFKKFLEACEADSRGRLGKEDEPYSQKDYLLELVDRGFESQDKSSRDANALAISGRDLMDLLGIPQGKLLGDIVKKLKLVVEQDPALNDKGILIEIAKKEFLK